MATTVSYQNNTIATVNNNTKTLKTAGKYMEADVVLTDVTSSGSGEGGGEVTLETVTKTYTPTESQQTDTITPSSGYDGIEEVDVTVNAISSSYVGSGITRRSSSDMTVSGATVTAPAGYYSSAGTKTVASGSAGTPTATKGTVSNNSVTVTPSVTNSTGYITGGTLTGSGVTVTAAELVNGSQSITENGTVDVTNLEQIIVNIAGGGVSGVISGTFINTTAGSSGEAMDINTGYTGTGYPVYIIITPTGGPNNTEYDFYNLNKRYATRLFMAYRTRGVDDAPLYGTSTDVNNKAMLVNFVKGSSATATTASSNSATDLYQNTAATGGSANTIVKIKNNTTISVYIQGSQYGFAKGYEYNYYILYSS